MNNKITDIINKLCALHTLEHNEYKQLLDNYSVEAREILADTAVAERKKIYGNSVYIRGLIEISNYCKNDCYYCGIRRSNSRCSRYRLTAEDILNCCKQGYELGFRTFVMQGGEDPHFTDKLLCDIINKIKQSYPDCAVTLSLGERSYNSYKSLKSAGADRYLLRHESADSTHYSMLHPKCMTLESRKKALFDLKELGFQVGCGFMVGSPYQTNANIATDLKFIEQFKPDMCGIGPFIPHKDTPFASNSAGTLEMTCYLLSIIRIMHPHILLPSTTALGTIHPFGREFGILSGANVVMPNLSPFEVRKKYMLYDNKASDGNESAQCKDSIAKRMMNIGYEIVTARGDVIK